MINNREIIALIAQVAELYGLKVSVRESLKGALIAGAGCFIGGVLLGPLGLAVGGTAGGVAASLRAREFRPLSDVLTNDLTERQQVALAARVRNIINDIGIEDAALLLGVIQGNFAIRELIMRSITQFVTSDLSLELLPS